MTNEVTFEPVEGCPPPPPDALIQFEVDALSFVVCGVEVFRLTSSGMEYKGQTVEDAGVAYREITAFFSAAKEAVNHQATPDATNAQSELCDLHREMLAESAAQSARAALAQPEPEGPTDEEIIAFWSEHCAGDGDAGIIRLARWGRPTQQPADGEVAEVVKWLRSRAGIPASPDFPAVAAYLTRAADLLERLSPPQPIPVSERLPEPEDCDADGEVWAWRRFDPEGDMDNGDHWCLAFHEWLEDEDCGFTYWLPAHALPVPGEVQA